MAGELQAGSVIQCHIRGHGDAVPGQQVHGEREARAVQQVGGKCQHGRALRLFPQQLNQRPPP